MVPTANKPRGSSRWLLACLLVGAGTALANPLFESDDALPIVLELPADDLLRHAQKRPTVNGKLLYRDAEGSEVGLEISITTRGKSRLEQCRYPPLRVNLKKKQVTSTLFAGQNKLKLVVPCRTAAAFIRYLAQEYQIYRAYNLLTNRSFRVRAVDVTFRDSEGRRKDQRHRAFFIESIGEVASRLEMTRIRTDVASISQLDPEQLAILTLFQYMVANTDWSARMGPPGEDCCHNSRIIGPAGSSAGWIIVPYDFDQAGLINASYAVVDGRLPIRRVRQRLYRGYCRNLDRLDGAIALFNERRAAIENLFANAAEKEADNRKAVQYLDDFFATINDPAKRQKRIINACQATRG